MEELLHIMSQARGPYHVDLITTAKRTRAARKAVAPLVKRRLQYNDGVAFGRLLPYLGIPKRYVEHVCTIILKDWGYPEHKAQAWMTNGEFVQGLDDTYRTMSQGFNDIGALDTGEETFSEFLTELEAAAFSPQKLCLPEPGVHPETIVKDESDDDWIVVKDEGADLENLGAVPEHSDGLRDV